jgi:hypothetical protein
MMGVSGYSAISRRNLHLNAARSDRPDLRQHTLEISAQRRLDLSVGVFAPDQSFGQIEDPLLNTIFLSRI